ncbi:hypothetical protein AWC38_SpisGene13872 [Stylophora pistillata]|uniref:Tripartite motif-containing protein 2 n=1 Tax=Stylophora pistillata TaxID=50429 RepID=A0A2B4RT74_STYPI|nr:hypothetical protein AWC38_SpisGene13872 [Stylophora pistillata]
MASIVFSSVFEIVLGLLGDNIRGKMAEKLRDGDVFDEEFRDLVITENNEIKSMLKGLSRKDLRESIIVFKEGIEILFEFFDKAGFHREYRDDAETEQATRNIALSLTQEMKKLDRKYLDDSTTQYLSEAKKRFKQAREKATGAFANEALNMSDRLLATRYRIMATILETLDSLELALVPCRACIRDLNCLAAVQNSFGAQVTTRGIKAVKSLFRKKERGRLISSVCHMNRVLYEVSRIVLGRCPLEMAWPSVDTGEGKVDPLRDERITNALQNQDIEDFCVIRSFGEDELKWVSGIATNSKKQFILTEVTGANIKVFDSCGKLVEHFSPPNKVTPLDVATDLSDNIFVLAVIMSSNEVNLNTVRCSGNEPTLFSSIGSETESVETMEIEANDEGTLWAYKYTKTAVLQRPLGKGGCDSKLSVDGSGNMIVLRVSYETSVKRVLEKYDSQGLFVRSFGEETTVKNLKDITTVNDGQVIALDRLNRCVHIFGENGQHLREFELQRISEPDCISFHQESGHVVAAGVSEENDSLFVEIYTKTGKFKCGHHIYKNGIS